MYYPQLFTGYWIPSDTPARPGWPATSTPGQIKDVAGGEVEELREWMNQRDRPVYIGP